MHSACGRFGGPGFAWEGDFLALGIGNGRQAGGGHVLCPQAQVDDGLLDVCIVPASQDVVGTLGTLLSGGILGLEAVSVSARLPWLEVEAPEGLDINLDGEPLSTLKTYRERDGDVYFGQNLLPRGVGELRVGMPVEVLE